MYMKDLKRHKGVSGGTRMQQYMCMLILVGNSAQLEFSGCYMLIVQVFLMHP